MKRYLLPVALLALFFSVSCKKETKSVTTPAVAINNQLTEEEKAQFAKTIASVSKTVAECKI